MTQLTVITPPAEAPVSLETVKAFLRVGHDGDDGLIADVLAAARERLEVTAGMAFIVQTIQVSWSEWPNAFARIGARLPRMPVRQLFAVRIKDADDHTIDVTDHFQLVGDRLCLRPWQSLPEVAPGGQIELEISVGFGAAADVPEDLREALLRLVGALYGARHPSSGFVSHWGGLPREVQAILDARKDVRL